MSDTPELRDLLKQLLASRSKRQIDLAEALGISQPAVSQMLKKDSFSIEHLVKLNEKIPLTAREREELLKAIAIVHGYPEDYVGNPHYVFSPHAEYGSESDEELQKLVALYKKLQDPEKRKEVAKKLREMVIDELSTDELSS